MCDVYVWMYMCVCGDGVVYDDVHMMYALPPIDQSVIEYVSF